MGDRPAVEGGVLEGSSRVLREFLAAPRTRQSLAVLLDNLDPDNAALVARALTDDPSLTMDVVVSTPALANAAATLGHQLLTQLSAVPPELVQDLAPRLLAEIDARRLGETAGLAVAMALRATDTDAGAEALRGFGDGFAEGLRAAMTDAGQPPGEALQRGLRFGLAHAGPLAEQLQRLAEEDPAFVKEKVGPLARAWRDVSAIALKEREADDG